MTDKFTSSDGIAVAYHRWGENNPGAVVVLHHGFASSADSNWVAPGIVNALVQSGRSVLAVDALAAIKAPTLVLAGNDDLLAVKPQRLADAIPGAQCLVLPGDHLSVLRQPGLAAAAIDFLNS